MILMAVADAQYRFIYVDVGAMGQCSDGGVWKRCSLHEDLYAYENPLNIPPPEIIDGMDEPLPYYLLGDDAFSLTTNLMKPYPSSGLTSQQRVFNYRLSRGRRIIENTFGILVSKFQIFQRNIKMLPLGVERVILASVVLHNFMRVKCGKTYIPREAVDQEINGELVSGAWRQDTLPLESITSTTGGNTYVRAKQMRNALANYFLTRQGEVSWQYRSACVD